MKKSKKIVIKNDETSVIDELNNASYVYGPPVYMGWKITNPYYDKPVTESATESETTTTEISADVNHCKRNEKINNKNQDDKIYWRI